MWEPAPAGRPDSATTPARTSPEPFPARPVRRATPGTSASSGGPQRARDQKSYGHLPSAMGDSGSKRSRASSGLVPSARAISGQSCPLARASCTSWGSQRSDCSTRLATRGHHRDIVAEPHPATFGERGHRVIDEIEGVLAAARNRIVAGHDPHSSQPAGPSGGPHRLPARAAAPGCRVAASPVADHPRLVADNLTRASPPHARRVSDCLPTMFDNKPRPHHLRVSGKAPTPEPATHPTTALQ